jgi:hypothetical protein
LSIALAVVISEQVMHGLGKHLNDLSDEDGTTSLKVSLFLLLQTPSQRAAWPWNPVEQY